MALTGKQVMYYGRTQFKKDHKYRVVIEEWDKSGNRVVKKHTRTVSARSRVVAWERGHRLALAMQRRKGTPYSVASVSIKPVDL